MAQRTVLAVPVFMSVPPGWLVAQTKEPGAVPAGAGDGERHLGQARIGLAIPGKALGQHSDPMHPPIPFPGQHGAGSDICDHPAVIHRAFARGLRRRRIVEKALALAVQIAEMIGLQPIGQHAKQEMPRQVRGRLPPEHVVPSGAKRAGVEIAQARNLDVERLRSGAGPTFTRGMASGRAALGLPSARLGR